ncbi:MAG: Gfo/Idh/MocA family oxidoreductase [Chloroflexota bacterium]|nr:Gfo/Idh/MocA family oxidoreductase [Chloroflexota bacterium]MDE2946139.1 Gfo/Idh/MocA family oxidoreductase [Chloroflexota bacterium]
MTRIRVAVIGAGGIAGAQLRAYAAQSGRCEIVGIADVDERAAKSRADEFGGRAFIDGLSMIEALRPDAVSICTPPKFRIPFVEAAAKRGIAVLCEKPPARTVAETTAIVDAMRGSLLQFAFCHRFHAPLQAAQDLIRSGKLGALVQIENRFAFRFGRAGGSWFTDADVAGGGILIDTLVHSIDIFRALTGDEIESARALLSSTLPIEVEDSASLLVRSRGGVLGTLNCSWVTPVAQAFVRIHGTEGQALIDYNADAGLQYKLADEENWTAQTFDEPDRFARQAAHFLDCIEGKRSPLVSGEDGLAVMRVIEMAYESAGVTR